MNLVGKTSSEVVIGKPGAAAQHGCRNHGQPKFNSWSGDPQACGLWARAGLRRVPWGVIPDANEQNTYTTIGREYHYPYRRDEWWPGCDNVCDNNLTGTIALSCPLNICLCLPIFFMTSSTTPKGTKTKKHGRQGEGGGRPRKQARSGRTITQQLLDDVLHGTPWDDDLEGAATGLSKEEESSVRDMKKDVIEMAQDADRENGPIGSPLSIFLFMNCDLSP